MRPLRGSCSQEKQKSVGSLVPLFHFVLLFFFYEYVRKNSRAFLINVSVVLKTESCWFGWGRSLIPLWIVHLDIYQWVSSLRIYVRLPVHVCVISYFRVYLLTDKYFMSALWCLSSQWGWHVHTLSQWYWLNPEPCVLYIHHNTLTHCWITVRVHPVCLSFGFLKCLHCLILASQGATVLPLCVQFFVLRMWSVNLESFWRYFWNAYCLSS